MLFRIDVYMPAPLVERSYLDEGLTEFMQHNTYVIIYHSSWSICFIIEHKLNLIGTTPPAPLGKDSFSPTNILKSRIWVSFIEIDFIGYNSGI